MIVVRSLLELVDDSDFSGDLKPLTAKPPFLMTRTRSWATDAGLWKQRPPFMPQVPPNRPASFKPAVIQHAHRIYLHNVTGYMVSVMPGESGIVKHGSKMIQAVSNASVPRSPF